MDGMSDCMVSFNRCEKEMVSRMEKTVPSAAFFAMLSCCSSTGFSIVKGVPVKVMAIRLRIGMFYFFSPKKLSNKAIQVCRMCSHLPLHFNQQFTLHPSNNTHPFSCYLFFLPVPF